MLQSDAADVGFQFAEVAMLSLCSRYVADSSSRRRVLNQLTHSRVAISTASRLRYGPVRWMTSVLNGPITVSARALGNELPTLPTEGTIPASARRSADRSDTLQLLSL